NHALQAVVLILRMPHLGIAQPAVTQLSWPHSYNTPAVSVALEQVQRVELERPVKQQLDVVEQDQIATRVLVGQLPHSDIGLKCSLPLGHGGETPSQRGSDIHYLHTAPIGQRGQQCALATARATDKQDQLAVQCRDLVYQTVQSCEHRAALYPFPP